MNGFESPAELHFVGIVFSSTLFDKDFEAYMTAFMVLINPFKGFMKVQRIAYPLRIYGYHQPCHECLQISI